MKNRLKYFLISSGVIFSLQGMTIAHSDIINSQMSQVPSQLIVGSNFNIVAYFDKDPGDSVKIAYSRLPAGFITTSCITCGAYIPRCFAQLVVNTKVPQTFNGAILFVSALTGERITYPISGAVINEPYTLTSLLDHVAKGEEDFVTDILQKYPNLALQTGTLTDPAGRTFTNITALQYALWAYDKHMWELILTFLSKDQAKQQIIALETNGTAHGKHYDGSPLMKAVADFAKDNNNNFAVLVGSAQRTAPAHVAQEYYRKDRSFYPTPAFDDKVLPRYDANTGVCSGWFPLNNGLGVNYALQRGESSKPSANPDPRNWHTRLDAAAINYLFPIREKQYQILKKSLGI